MIADVAVTYRLTHAHGCGFTFAFDFGLTIYTGYLHAVVLLLLLHTTLHSCGYTLFWFTHGYFVVLHLLPTLLLLPYPHGSTHLYLCSYVPHITGWLHGLVLYARLVLVTHTDLCCYYSLYGSIDSCTLVPHLVDYVVTLYHN